MERGGEAELSSQTLRGPHPASPGYRQNTTQKDHHSSHSHTLGYNRNNSIQGSGQVRLHLLLCVDARLHNVGMPCQV